MGIACMDMDGPDGMGWEDGIGKRKEKGREGGVLMRAQFALSHHSLTLLSVYLLIIVGSWTYTDIYIYDRIYSMSRVSLDVSPIFL